MPVRADECRLLSASAYDNPGRRGNLTYYYDGAGCYDYNDPSGNHDSGYYYNNYDYDYDYDYDNNDNGGKLLR